MGLCEAEIEQLGLTKFMRSLKCDGKMSFNGTFEKPVNAPILQGDVVKFYITETECVERLVSSVKRNEDGSVTVATKVS